MISIGVVLWDKRQRVKLLYLPKGFMCYRNIYMDKNRKCAAEANDGDPSQTVVTINKAVSLHNFHRVYKHTSARKNKMNKIHLTLHPKICPTRKSLTGALTKEYQGQG